VLNDLRYAFRMMLKHRVFTCVAVLALGLGIGANTAIFSVINAVVLQPLPYSNPERLVTILHEGAKPLAPANYLDVAAQSKSFAAIAAAQWWEPNLMGRDQPEHLRGLQLTAQMFQVLGVSPQLGRTFNADEDQPGRERVVVLSHRLWQRRFGGDAGVVGQQVTFDGESYTVIGVMPPDFQFAPFWATSAELWSPLDLSSRATNRGGQSLRVFALLKPAVTRAMAQAEVATIFSRLEQEYPEVKGLAIAVEPLHERVVGKTRPALMILFGAVSFVLLIACANVANLMIARATSRQKEIALRTALGASSTRIARQLLTESVLIAFIGGFFGLLLSIAGMRALLALGPDSLPRLQTIRLDLPTLGFTFGLSVITGLLFGLAPVLQTRKWNWYESLKESTRGSSAGRSRVNVRRLLVISEVALALMLLVGGGLMVRSFARLRAVDPGFKPDNLLTMTISLAGSAHNTAPKRVAFFDELLQRIESVPGVQSASGINHLPLAGDVWTVPFFVEGRPIPPPSEKQGAVYRIVRPNYFRTMGATLLKGRDFTPSDNDTSTPVVIINEPFAKRHWPNEDPLGTRIRVSDKDSELCEIVGVVNALKQDQWTAEPNLEMYLPHLQAAAPRGLALVVRTSGDPTALVGPIENQVWSIDKNLPVSDIRTMQEVVAGSIEQHRFNLFLLGLFAFVALVLALVGTYGVMSESVSARTHEIGIRMALGARAADVLRMVVRQGMTLAAIGIGIGLFGAFWLTKFMATLLYEVSPTDSATFLSIPLIVALVVLGACLIPARRATKVDPVIALRDE
jgi:putative ABC transport system permease protein